MKSSPYGFIPENVNQEIDSIALVQKAEQNWEMIKADFPTLTEAEIEENIEVIDEYYEQNLDYVVLNEIAENEDDYADKVALKSLKNKTSQRFSWSCVFNVTGVIFGFYTGLQSIPLVQAIMLAYVGPVLIVLLAKPLLGESLDPYKVAGVTVGFVGVFIVVRPTEFTVSPAIFAVLGSAFCWALLSLSNRQLKDKVSTSVLTFYAYPVTLIASAVWTMDSWTTPDTSIHWLLFLTIAISSLATQVFVTLAYKHSEAGRVAPFEYTALIWVTIGGFVFWQEVPLLSVWVGGAATILGGYIALRK